MLYGYSNAFYDTASIYPWEKVYMQSYVKGVLDELSNIMPGFNSFRFYFFHATEDVIPASIEDNHPKKILIQTGDQLGKEPKDIVMSSYLFVFKTHLRYQTGKYNNLAPYPLGLPSETPLLPIKDIKDRKFDVFYSGNINNNRIDFYRSFLNLKKIKFKWVIASILLKALKTLQNIRWFELKLKGCLFKLNCYNFDDVIPNSYIRFTRAFQAGLKIDEYAEMLANSKIVLSPKGFFNTECFRLYEALRQGCIVITEPQPIKSTFYNKKYYIEVENWDNVNNVIKDLLKDESKMQSMSDNGVKYYNETLSPKGVAKYVVKTINTFLK